MSKERFKEIGKNKGPFGIAGGALFFRSDEIFVILGFGVAAVGREKFLDGEADTCEQCAGVILGRALALLFGDTVVVSRYKKLGVALEPDYGKLP